MENHNIKLLCENRIHLDETFFQQKAVFYDKFPASAYKLNKQTILFFLQITEIY